MTDRPIRPHQDAHAPTNPPKRNLVNWKPGSESDQSGQIGSKGDFGVHAGKATQADRDYTSRNAKASDPGASMPWSHEHDGNRQSGAAARDSGPGSASGGDVDTDVVGVGSGSGLSQSGPDLHSAHSPKPGQSERNQVTANDDWGDDVDDDAVESSDERSAAADARGADAASTGRTDPVYGDSQAGEVSADEAAGGDSVRP